MSTNGSIPRGKVVNHLADDIADAQERIGQLQASLDRQVAAYRIDRSDDPLQETSIRQVQDLLDVERQRLTDLRRSAAAIEAGNPLPDYAFKPQEVRT